MPASQNVCGRAVAEGSTAYSFDGVVICSGCFKTPDVSVEYVEGKLPVDGVCGRLLQPQPPASPLDEVPPEGHLEAPEQPAELSPEVVGRLEEYAQYLQQAVAAGLDSLPYSEWLEMEEASTPAGNVELGEIMDETVQMALRLVERAYALGKGQGRG